MSEIKQLLMNAVFKKIMHVLFFLVSSSIILFFNYDNWIKYKSWVEMLLLVILFQFVTYFFIKFIPLVPFKKWINSLVNKFYRDPINKEVEEEIKLINLDFDKLFSYFKNPVWFSFLSKFLNPRIKLPLYICFESTSNIANESIKKSHYQEFPATFIGDKAKIVLSDKAIFCIISPQLLKEEGLIWIKFLKVLKKYSKIFSSISVCVFLNSDVEKLQSLTQFIKSCRYKVDQMEKSLNQILPSYAMDSMLLEDEKFKEFIKDDTVWDGEVLKERLLNISVSEKMNKLSRLINRLIYQMHAHRFLISQKSNKIKSSWENFIFSNVDFNLIKSKLLVWKSFFEDSVLSKKSNMHSLYLIDRNKSYQGVWQDIESNTIEFERNGVKNRAWKINLGKLNIVLVFLITIIGSMGFSQIRCVSNFLKCYSQLDNNIEIISSVYAKYLNTSASYNNAGNIFSLSNFQKWHVIEDKIFFSIKKELSKIFNDIKEGLKQENKEEFKYQDKSYSINYQDVKALLTLINHSPEKLENQIIDLLEWMQYKKIIHESGRNDTQLLLKDYFKKNNAMWILNELDKGLYKKLYEKIKKLSPVEVFMTQLSAVEKNVNWDTLEKYDLFFQEDHELIELKYILPKIYSEKGYKNIILPLIEDFCNDIEKNNWVFNYQHPDIGKERKIFSREHIKSEIKKAYFNRYEMHLERFFKNIYIKPFSNIKDASLKLEKLLCSDGVLPKLSYFILENTKPLIVERKSHLRMMDHFLNTKKDENKAKKVFSYEEYLQELIHVRSELDGFSITSDQAYAIEEYYKNLFNQTVDSKNALSTLSTNMMHLKTYSRTKLEDSLFDLYVEPLSKLFIVLSKHALTSIEKDWRSDIAEVFNVDFAKKFPFKNVEEAVPLNEFSSFFSPKKGKMYTFIEERIKPLIKNHRGKIVPKTWMGCAAPIHAKFLSDIEFANMISDGLFNQKTGELAIHLQLLPEPSPYFSDFSIEVNGVGHDYHNDPEEWKLLTWPGESVYPKSMFSATSVEPKMKFFERLSGEWSFFKLLKRYAKWKRISPGNYHVYFEFETDKKEDFHYPIIFKLKTDNKIDFFKIIENNNVEIAEKIYAR